MNEQIDIAINFIKSKTTTTMSFDEANSLINHLAKLKIQEEMSPVTSSAPVPKKKK